MSIPVTTSRAGIPPSLKRTAGAAITEFERECVWFFEDVVQIFGVPKSVGQIYGVLYASPRPLSFSDIVERLGISKGSASQGLQLLRLLGAIVEAKCNRRGAATKEPDSPADAAAKSSLADGSDSVRTSRVMFEPELSLRRLLGGVLRERIAPLTANGADRLARLHELAVNERDRTAFFLGRAKQLTTWRRRLKAILPVLVALLGPKTPK